MNSPAQFNFASLMAVKPELDNLLDQVSRDLDIYFSVPENGLEALQSALAGFHRVSDMLQTLALDGVTVYCGEIEVLLLEFLAGMMTPSPVYRNTFQNALLALTHHLDALAEGANKPVLCLFPQYQELQQARGMEMAFEVDLFFPDLRVELPPHVLAQPLVDTPQEYIKAERGKYQAALVKWLRQEDSTEALQSMRGAVQAVMGGVPPDRQRAFWWVSSALLDCMIYQGLPPEQDTRKLLSRIDLQMKSLAEGQSFDTNDSLREMLYLIVCGDEVSGTVTEVRKTYALESYLPQADTLSESKTAPVLESMRMRLDEAKENWEECAQVGFVTPDFTGQLAQLASLAEQLDRNTLQYLCQQIQAVVSQEHSAEQIQNMAMDMAMALLLLGSGMEHYRQLGGAFHEQAQILSQRLQVAIAYEPQDENKFADLVSLYCRMEEPGVTSTLIGEIQTNLQHVEQELSSFSGDAGKPPALAQLELSLHQVQGGLRMLSLGRPEPLLNFLLQAMGYFAAGGNPAPDAIRTVVAALDALQVYVQDVALGSEPDDAQLDSALQDIQVLQQSFATKISKTQVTGTAVQTVAKNILWEGDELLEVFLEEAQEVLDNMRTNIEILQLQPESHEPLVTIRRGFHTLKGSGRMVGLTDLAEVAWAVERAMNKWLHENKQATPGLLKFILDADTAFNGWVNTLRARGSMQVEADELVRVAQQIETGAEAILLASSADPIAATAAAEIPAASVVSEPESESESEPEPEPEHESEPEPEPEPEPELELTPAIENIPQSEQGHDFSPLKWEFVDHPDAGLRRYEAVFSNGLFGLELGPGAVALSSSQFGIVAGEAAQHVAALLWHLTELRESRYPAVSDEFLHEAYSLAVANRAMGLTQSAELAYALEQWLEAHMGHPIALSDAQLSLLERTVAVLDDMSLAIRNRQELKAQPELIARLHADREAADEQAKKRWLASEAPLSETPPSGIQVAQQVGADVTALDVENEVDEHLLPIFLEEANDIFPQVGGALRAWCERPEDKALGRSLQRGLHTLKGSARMAGAMHLGDLTHQMEERVVQAMQKEQYDAAFRDELEDCFDGIATALEQLRDEQPLADQATAGATETGGASPRATPSVMLRVRSDTVDRLVNEAGEISVARSRIEAELRSFKSGLLELVESVGRLRGQLREMEIQAEGQMQARVSLSEDTAEKFDPLEFDRFTRFQELTRFMNESVHDVLTVQQTLLKNLDETAAALSTQTYLSRELQRNLMVIRMVPFANISERLYRVVRQTCKELNKKANLELNGTEVELDRSVLDKMTAPFEHMLRNAVAHGLENPQQREQLGKPPTGVICLSLRQEGNEVIFECSDDGAGINLAQLRQKAVELGIFQPDEDAGDEQAMQLIFTPGLTTATEVTEISGRGVGMDVVHSEITALGGRIEVSSKPGKGTRFIIHLPLTLMATQALLVRAGQATYAIPSGMVEQVQQVKPAALKGIYSQGRVEWKGKPYPLHYLQRLLGDEESVPESHPYNRVLLLHSGEQRLAVHVDDLIGNQEMVVKNMGPQLAHLSGIAGATVLGNGSVVLMLNPVQLAQRILGARKTARAAVEPMPAPPLVMVVDDSLTVRKITGRLLARAGYHVVTAKDGVDALEQLGEISPAVMLLDIEMPRMDGFELTRHLRREPRTQHLPIIMITSRTAEKHRGHAHELGVNVYLGKPYQEEELLQYIAAIVSTR